jgi:hypothetical protein
MCVMRDFAFLSAIVLGLGVSLWNDYLRAKIESLDVEISILKLEKKEVIADFRNYQIEVKKAVCDFNGGMFKLQGNS